MMLARVLEQEKLLKMSRTVVVQFHMVAHSHMDMDDNMELLARLAS